jgi:hypothetical protein
VTKFLEDYRTCCTALGRHLLLERRRAPASLQ